MKQLAEKVLDAGDHLRVREVRSGVRVAEADAALPEERAHRAVPDEYPVFEQFSEVQAQE